MKAMVLAAGVGSRLRPLTDARPKALIEVGGTPMLEIVIRRLMRAGVKAVIVNLFHHADQIAAFLKDKKNFGIHIALSREAPLLDTGGGLKKAADFFDDGQPFFLHNVDVFSDLDLKRMYDFHKRNQALATLAVQERPTERYLLFDDRGWLCGRETLKKAHRQVAVSSKREIQRLAFNGIHVISPEIFGKLTESGVFSIIEAYARLAGQGERIQAFRADEYAWSDMGSLESLEKLRRQG